MLWTLVLTSRAISRSVVDQLTIERGGGEVLYRDLAADPLPHLTLEAFAADWRRQGLVGRGVEITSGASRRLGGGPADLTHVLSTLGIRYLRLDQLAELLARFPRNPGSNRLWPLLASSSGPTRSEFEDAFLEFSQQFGFPQPQVNVRIGRYVVDMLFPRERVIVELDSWEFHGDRITFETDRERDANTAAVGYPTVRLTPRRLTTPAQEADRLQRILATRRRAASPPRPALRA